MNRKQQQDGRFNPPPQQRPIACDGSKRFDAKAKIIKLDLKSKK